MIKFVHLLMEVFLFFRVTRIRNWRRLHRKAEIMNLISQPKRQRADLTSRLSTLHGSSSDFYRLFFIFKSFHFILPRLSHSPYRTVYFSPVSSLARCLNRSSLFSDSTCHFFFLRYYSLFKCPYLFLRNGLLIRVSTCKLQYTS